MTADELRILMDQVHEALREMRASAARADLRAFRRWDNAFWRRLQVLNSALDRALA